MEENKEISNQNLDSNYCKKTFSEAELTQHAMRVASSALAKDWENEDDAYWEAFLDK